MKNTEQIARLAKIAGLIIKSWRGSGPTPTFVLWGAHRLAKVNPSPATCRATLVALSGQNHFTLFCGDIGAKILYRDYYPGHDEKFSRSDAIRSAKAAYNRIKKGLVTREDREWTDAQHIDNHGRRCLLEAARRARVAEAGALLR